MAKRGSTPWIGFVVLLALLAVAGWTLRSCDGEEDAAQASGEADTGEAGEPAAPTTAPDTPAADSGLRLVDSGDPTPDLPSGETDPPEVVPTPPPVSPERAAAMRETYARGRARHEAGDLVEARKLLSEALASGVLSSADQRDCRQRLDAIVAILVFSREIHPGDPYAREYRVKPGETLSGIVRSENLYIPHEGVQRINQILDPRTIQPHQRLKLIQGPFDAIITMHDYTLDLYHHGMFVKSFRIGLGQDGSTPTGRWRVRDRVRRARWTPPPGSDQTRTLECGEPGYPLGAEGLWIALDGMERSNEMVSGFGIHGTDAPDSIGRQASLGCIRLADDDIALVFDLLYPGKSNVEVRP